MRPQLRQDAVAKKLNAEMFLLIIGLTISMAVIIGLIIALVRT